jgi:hypothetical protein
MGIVVLGSSISLGGGSAELDTSPDGAHCVRIEGTDAVRLSHLSMYRDDLTVARSCLDFLGGAASAPPLIRDALWRAAIVHYAKCFGTSRAHFRLPVRRILPDPTALVAHQYFLDLRERYVVHDERRYGSVLPGAVIAAPDSAQSVDAVTCVSVFDETLTPTNHRHLDDLVDSTRAWVEEQHGRVTERLLTQLRGLTREQLESMQPLSGRPHETTATVRPDVGAQR